MTEFRAMMQIRHRIDTASKFVGNGVDGKSFEDLEIAIQALEKIQAYQAIGTVEEFKALKEMVSHLLSRHLHQTIELYSRDECVYDLEPILLRFGISSEVLDRYKV